MAPRLFGTAGIRGPYLSRVTPRLAYKLGLALAAMLGDGSATVGYDVRTTSPLLASMAASGLMAGGVDAIMLGVVPLPVASYSVPRTNSRVGVMVTASHNPPPDNGLKVIGETGMEFTASMEEELEALMEREEQSLLAPWDRVGRLLSGSEVRDYYMEDLVARLVPDGARRRPFLAVDCASGAASRVTPLVLRRLGVERLVTFNCQEDGLFPGRQPEPRPDVLKPFIDAAVGLGAEALLAHDGDADRLALGVPGYGFVKQDLVIALLAWWKLRDSPGTIIVSVDVGLEVQEVVEEMGGRLVRARLGKIHEKLLEEEGAVLAAEPWKLIDPAWGRWVDGIYQAGLITHISMVEGRSIRELLDMLPFYPSARVSFKVPGEAERDRLYEALIEEFTARFSRNAVNIIAIDGVRVEYEDGSWVLLRRSGTEPKVRAYMQARSSDKLEAMLSALKDLVLRQSQRLGIRLLAVEEHVSHPPGGPRGFRGHSG